jgi:hypothetical protein
MDRSVYLKRYKLQATNEEEIKLKYLFVVVKKQQLLS